MKRRDFLKTLLSTGALYSAGGLPALSYSANAAGFPNPPSRILVNVMLSGAPDMRHLLPPAYDNDPTSYGYQYWQARAASHGLDNIPANWQSRWDNDFSARTGGSSASFGILNSCEWLKQQWDNGNVAIINNAVGGETRNHSHCRMIMDQGNLSSLPADSNRSGWGGRLANASARNVLALTKIPRRFCFSTDPDNPEGHKTDDMISVRDSRNLALFEAADGDNPKLGPSKLSRSMSAYYTAKQISIADNSPFRKFIRHEQTLRTIGRSINTRLDNSPVPAAIQALIDGGLESEYLGTQMRNLYDSLLTSDILNFNTVSMESLGWDTHKLQRESIEPRLVDLFGTGKAMDTLYSEVDSSVLDQMVFVIGGEFGRQLRANGDGGTDHGRGTSILIIGNQVNGGIYGDMFPNDEISRLTDNTPDIVGQTTFDHIFGRVCEWVQPGSEALVFPDRSLSRLEAGVDLSGLFA